MDDRPRQPERETAPERSQSGDLISHTPEPTRRATRRRGFATQASCKLQRGGSTLPDRETRLRDTSGLHKENEAASRCPTERTRKRARSATNLQRERGGGETAYRKLKTTERTAARTISLLPNYREGTRRQTCLLQAIPTERERGGKPACCKQDLQRENAAANLPAATENHRENAVTRAIAWTARETERTRRRPSCCYRQKDRTNAAAT